MTPPGHVLVQVCRGCGRVLDGSLWKNALPEDVAARQLEAGTRKHGQVKSVRWSVPYLPPEKGEHRVMCTAVLSIEDDELAQERGILIRVRPGSCTSCSRQSGDYYEAVIQLRIEGLAAKDAETELAEENATVMRMTDEYSEFDDKAFITKQSPVKGGIDYYVGSLAMARAIAAKIRSQTGANVNESPSLVGQKDGADMYRNSILVKLPTHREGDVVAYDRKIHVVEESDSKVAVLKNASDGQIVRVKPDDPKLKHVSKYRDVMQAVVVSHDKTTLQVLDPDSMAMVTVLRPPYLKRVGENVRVVRYDGELHAV
jgi:nonsense-mediated mRNA decay protein 3